MRKETYFKMNSLIVNPKLESMLTNHERTLRYKEVCLQELYPNKNYLTKEIETFKVRQQTIDNLLIINKNIKKFYPFAYENNDIYKYIIKLKYTSSIDKTIKSIESLWFISIYSDLDDMEIKLLSMYILNNKYL
jgi:hypothetical protein